jgi:serine/threonine protein kinase
MASPWDSDWNPKVIDGKPKAVAKQNQADAVTARPPRPQHANHGAPPPAHANTTSFNWNEILFDWSRLGLTSARHVDLQGQELPPGFVKHELLGSSNSVVIRVEVHGTSLAMKTYYGKNEERLAKVLAEISILRRLHHHHIIEYVGSMTQTSPASLHRPTLSALFWPVAPCGLDQFMQEIDTLALAICNGDLKGSELADSIRDPVHGSAASLLRGIVFPVTEQSNVKRTSKVSTILRAAIRRLFASFGCLAEALFYVHRQHISHKDVKPSNILVYPNESSYQSTESNPQGQRVRDGLRLTDFDGANDFSQAPVSTAEHSWFTTLYASPETLNKRESGRGCDIFSMGCVYLEMLALATIFPYVSDVANQADPGPPPPYFSGGELRAKMGPSAAHRAEDGKLANLVAKVGELLPAQPPEQREGTYRLQSIIQSMLSLNPASRPSADILTLRLSAADVLRQASLSPNDRTLSSYPLFGKCCDRFALSVDESQQLLLGKETEAPAQESEATTNDQDGTTTPRAETPAPAPDKGRQTPPPLTPASSNLQSVDGVDDDDDQPEDRPSETNRAESPVTAFTVPPVVRDEYMIQWNKHGQRIDPPTIEYNKAAFDRVKKLNLCQYRYLMGVCNNVDTCKFAHHYKLSGRDLEILRALKRRQQVCRTSCPNSACFAGHNCPNMWSGTLPEDRTKTSSCCFGGPMGNCYFPSEMHDMDLRVASCTY